MNITKPETKINNGTGNLTTYYEAKRGKERFCVTSVYKGEIDFSDAMENLITKKILREISSGK